MNNYYQRIDKEDRRKSGFVALYSKGNRLYFRLPDSLGLGRSRYIATGLPNTVEGRSQATRTITAINNDILLEQFDPTLEKYLSRYKTEGYKAEIEGITGVATSLQSMWKAYCNYKKSRVKESTLFYLEETIGSKIYSLPTTNIYDVKKIRDYLLETSTPDYAKRILTKLSALFDWAKDSGTLKGNNPYPEVVKKLEINKGKKPPSPLTEDEVNELLEKISNTYKPLTQFLLLTGCRPSEAIGLRWKEVKFNEGHIILGRSIVKKSGKVFLSETSKNNKVRTFPLYPRLENLLENLTSNRDGLVFLNGKGEAIDYNTYYQHFVEVSPKKGTTPYSCRDTFITNQIELGKPVAVVAQWVDNSIQIIESTYLKVGNKVKPE